MISFSAFIQLTEQELKPNSYTRRELEEMDWSELCMIAYGVKDDDLIKLKLSDIKIRYKDDLVNPIAIFNCEIKKNGKCGMDWVRSVDLDEPVMVSLGKDGKATKEDYYLENGHHRLFCAKKLKKPFILAQIESVNLKAIEKILQYSSRKD